MLKPARWATLLLVLTLAACDAADTPLPPSPPDNGPEVAATTPATPGSTPGSSPVPTIDPNVGIAPDAPTVTPEAPDGTVAPPNPQPPAEVGLAGFAIDYPLIESDRSRVPQGTLTLAFYTNLDAERLDPQQAQDSFISYALFLDHIFDPMIGATSEGRFTYLLADHFEMTGDFRKATLRLREGVRFHNGAPVTADDVKFTYENYSGANAQTLHNKTQRVEVVDGRTVSFYFNEPFADFLLLYGSRASGAGYIVPQEYYREVGPEGFIQAPIGAGAYRVVGPTGGQEITLEAFPDYWRKVPHIQKFITRGVPDLVRRVADLRTGEADVAYFITGPLLREVVHRPGLRVTPNNTAAFWLFFPGLEDPENPFSDPRVREAVSLVLDREALAQAETVGLGAPTGNFIPPGKPGRIERPVPEFHRDRARQLMAEAGYPDGFVLDSFTPFPPVFSLGERLLESLRELGIRGELKVTSRTQFLEMLQQHRQGFPGVQMGFGVSLDPPDAFSYFHAFARCNQGLSVNCDPGLEELITRYETSLDLAEREQLVAELQSYVLDRFIFVPLYLDSFPIGAGPRIRGDLAQHTRVHPYLFPYEDIQLNP